MKRFIGRVLLWRHWDNVQLTLFALWMWSLLAFFCKYAFHLPLLWCYIVVPFAFVLLIVFMFGIMNLWDFLTVSIKRYIESAKEEAMR